MGHKVFCLAPLKNYECPGGSHLVMKIAPIFLRDRPLMTIEYKYNSPKVLGFISTNWGGGTEPGDTYLSRFPENYYNTYILPDFLPSFLPWKIFKCL